MLVTFLAGNVLGQPRLSEASHLMRVEETKIHCFADVPVGFGPRFADLENFDRRKFEPATIEDGGHALEQLAAFFEWRAAPRLKRASRRFRCALGFGNSGLSNQANDLIDRKSTRLNSSHSQISYAVCCFKKKEGRDRSASPECRQRARVRRTHLGESIAVSAPWLLPGTGRVLRAHDGPGVGGVARNAPRD